MCRRKFCVLHKNTVNSGAVGWLIKRCGKSSAMHKAKNIYLQYSPPTNRKPRLCELGAANLIGLLERGRQQAPPPSGVASFPMDANSADWRNLRSHINDSIFSCLCVLVVGVFSSSHLKGTSVSYSSAHKLPRHSAPNSQALQILKDYFKAITCPDD